MIHGDDDVRCAHSPHEGRSSVHRGGCVHAVAHERSSDAGRGGRVSGAGDVSDVLAQVIAGSFFAMEAGEAWRGGGYSQPVPNAGDMQLAQDISYTETPKPRRGKKPTAERRDRSGIAFLRLGVRCCGTRRSRKVTFETDGRAMRAREVGAGSK